METFVSAHPELAEADRQMLLGWRDVVEGVFEIRERDGEAIIAVNLIDELTYRVYSNAGPAALAPMEPGCFMTARIVPIGVGWMLSGRSRRSTRPSGRRRSRWQRNWRPGIPGLVFRNPRQGDPGLGVGA